MTRGGLGLGVLAATLPWLTGCSSAAQPGAPAAADSGAGCPASCAGTCAAGRCIVELAQTMNPTDIAVDATSVYFASCPMGTNGGDVLSVPLGAVRWMGGMQLFRYMSLASTKLALGCPITMALGGPGLFLNLQGVLEVSRTGGRYTQVVSGEPVVGMATDVDTLYWTTAGGRLLKVPFAGGAETVLAAGQGHWTRPVVDGSSVYWGDIDATTVRKVPLDGGAVTTVTTAGTVTALAVRGAYVYFAAGYLMMRAPIAGGPAMPVGTAAGGAITAVAVDNVSAYYTSDGAVWKAPLDGSSPSEALATGQGEPNAIAVDATSAYWTNALDGRVMKATPK